MVPTAEAELKPINCKSDALPTVPIECDSSIIIRDNTTKN